MLHGADDAKGNNLPCPDEQPNMLFGTPFSHRPATLTDAFHIFAILHPTIILYASSIAKLEYCFSCLPSANEILSDLLKFGQNQNIPTVRVLHPDSFTDPNLPIP